MPSVTELSNMVKDFRVEELKALLKTARKSVSGRKSELIERALSLLPGTTVVQNRILELHRHYTDRYNGSTPIPEVASVLSPQRQSPRSAARTLQPRPSSSDASNSSVPGTSNTGSTSSSSSSARYCFKNLPFYKVLHDLVPMTQLRQISSNNGRRHQNFFNFKLTTEQMRSLNSKYSPGRPPRVEAQLRMILAEPGERIDEWPQGCNISIAGHPVVLPKELPKRHANDVVKRANEPVDITELLFRDGRMHRVDVAWDAPINVHYVITVRLVRHVTVEILLQELKDRPLKPNVTRDKIIEKYRSQASDGDIAEDVSGMRIPLLCPITRSQMTYPCRPIDCDHLSCFDALAFLSVYERKPSWKCARCDKATSFDKFHIDQFMVSVGANAPADTVEVEFDEKADWKYIKEEDENDDDGSSTANEHAPATEPAPSAPVVEVISISDSEDEEQSRPSSSQPSPVTAPPSSSGGPSAPPSVQAPPSVEIQEVIAVSPPHISEVPVESPRPLTPARDIPPSQPSNPPPQTAPPAQPAKVPQAEPDTAEAMLNLREWLEARRRNGMWQLVETKTNPPVSERVPPTTTPATKTSNNEPEVIDLVDSDDDDATPLPPAKKTTPPQDVSPAPSCPTTEKTPRHNNVKSAGPIVDEEVPSDPVQDCVLIPKTEAIPLPLGSPPCTTMTGITVQCRDDETRVVEQVEQNHADAERILSELDEITRESPATSQGRVSVKDRLGECQVERLAKLARTQSSTKAQRSRQMEEELNAACGAAEYSVRRDGDRAKYGGSEKKYGEININRRHDEKKKEGITGSSSARVEVTGSREASSKQGTVSREVPSKQGTVSREVPSKPGTISKEASSKQGTCTISKEASSKQGMVSREASSKPGTISREASSKQGTVCREASSKQGTSSREASSKRSSNSSKNSSSSHSAKRRHRSKSRSRSVSRDRREKKRHRSRTPERRRSPPRQSAKPQGRTPTKQQESHKRSPARPSVKAQDASTRTPARKTQEARVQSPVRKTVKQQDSDRQQSSKSAMPPSTTPTATSTTPVTQSQTAAGDAFFSVTTAQKATPIADILHQYATVPPGIGPPGVAPWGPQMPPYGAPFSQPPPPVQPPPWHNGPMDMNGPPFCWSQLAQPPVMFPPTWQAPPPVPQQAWRPN